MSLGLPEIIIIAAIILLLFGSTKLPGLARSLGRAQNEFKAGLAEGTEKKNGSSEADKPASDK